MHNTAIIPAMNIIRIIPSSAINRTTALINASSSRSINNTIKFTNTAVRSLLSNNRLSIVNNNNNPNGTVAFSTASNNSSTTTTAATTTSTPPPITIPTGSTPSITAYESLLVYTLNSVLYITLNRPSLHNAFNEYVIAELTEAFTSEINNTHRCVVLQSTGSSFSAGADLNWMNQMRLYSQEQNRLDSIALFNMIYSIYNCPIPTIAAVQGSALGGGVGLISACDLSVSVNNSTIKFGLTEVKLGLAPAVISRFVLNKIGRNNASRYFLTGERMSAVEAHRIGLINELVQNDSELANTVGQWIKEIQSASPAAVKRSKQLIQHVSSIADPLDSRDYVTSMIAELRVSTEGQDGIGAFLEKRKPKWINNNGNSKKS